MESVETEILLFVGGMMDGKRASVPTKNTVYQFPFSPERLVLKCCFTDEALAKSVRTGQTPYIYYKATFHAGNGGTFKFMVHSSVPVDKAMEKLLKFYSPPDPLKELYKNKKPS